MHHLVTKKKYRFGFCWQVADPDEGTGGALFIIRDGQAFTLLNSHDEVHLLALAESGQD